MEESSARNLTDSKHAGWGPSKRLQTTHHPGRSNNQERACDWLHALEGCWGGCITSLCQMLRAAGREDTTPVACVQDATAVAARILLRYSTHRTVQGARDASGHTCFGTVFSIHTNLDAGLLMWTGILWDKGLKKKVKCCRHLTTRVSTP